MEVKKSNLCFDDRLFMEKDFSVDEFLTKHRKIANLETLRDDLGIFLKNLRSATIELINKDYADFVQLSTNLVSLEERIKAIETPMGRIRDEILSTKTMLDERIDNIEELIRQRKLVRKQMQSIRSFIRIENSLEQIDLMLSSVSNSDNDYFSNIVKLERVINEINQYNFHLKQCDSHHQNSNHVQDFNKLFQKCLLYLNGIFVLSVKSEKKGLVNCLRIYFSLNQTSLAHELVRKEIVSPAFSKIINEEALRNEPADLAGVYAKVILFIDTDLKQLMDLTQQQQQQQRNKNVITVKGFDFMVHSVWPELEERLEMNLKSIYSPSNPDIFFKKYTTTLAFLDQFEERCVTQSSAISLRKLSSYQNLLHCWNLPVYYTLRFQELGGNLEKIIHSSKSFAANGDNDTWKLYISKEIWLCLHRCWDENIFIRQIAHRFWKFNLQILSRFRVWMQDSINHKTVNQLPAARINFLIYLHADGFNVIERLPELFSLVKQRIDPDISHGMLENMQKCLDESKESLHLALKQVEAKIVELISEKNSPVVRQVNDIPRLYRRTNRNKPTQPCSYVSTLFAPVYELQKLHTVHTSKWITPTLSAVTTMYYEQVSEVLISVQRTEESLRKFKKIRDPSNMDSKQNTDDDLIRLQLQIDIEHYINAINDLTKSPDDINKLNDLRDVLSSLKRNS